MQEDGRRGRGIVAEAHAGEEHRHHRRGSVPVLRRGAGRGAADGRRGEAGAGHLARALLHRPHVHRDAAQHRQADLRLLPHGERLARHTVLVKVKTLLLVIWQSV